MNLKIGDKIVVYGIHIHATVDKIWYDKSGSRYVIELDWGEFGHSKVYDHDENDIWFKYTGTN
jgi:hypothetical protein